MTDVFVLGAGMIKFGRYPDRTPFQIGAEAALLALDDAGVSIKDPKAPKAAVWLNRSFTFAGVDGAASVKTAASSLSLGRSRTKDWSSLMRSMGKRFK